MPDYIEELNESQRAAVLYGDGPSLVIAGAGSGKTRVLTYKIAYLLENGYNPWNILALTFTNKAAREMKERIARQVGEQRARYLWMGTFHSVFSRILRAEASHIGFTSQFTIYDSADSKSLLRSIIKEMGLDEKTYKPGSVQARISNAKNHLVSPSGYAANKEAYEADAAAKMPAIRDIYSRYWERCRQAGAMDFDDLLVYTYILFRDFPEVLARYREQFRYVLVDEYQDTNYAQHSIVLQLTKENQRVCVVGDDAQSIYSFRGADIDNILYFTKIYPDTKVFKLEQNYRSTQTIVRAANSLIEKNERQIPKEVFSEKERGEAIGVFQAYSDVEEGDIVTNKIAQLRREHDYGYSDFAILYRTNAQSRLLEEKCIEHNVPYRLVGGVNFYQRQEIKDILAYLKTIDSGRDDLSVTRIVNVPKRGIGQATLNKLDVYASEHGMRLFQAMEQVEQIPGMGKAADKIKGFVNQIMLFRALAKELDAAELIESILEQTGYLEELEKLEEDKAQAKQENLDEFQNKAADYYANHDEAALTDFLEEVALVADIDNMDSEADSLTLMTLHSAKGLEFPVVYMTGMEEGLFPSYMSMNSGDPGDIEEERRLCYVGITRAMQQLTLTAAKQRMVNGKIQHSTISRFVKELPQEKLDWKEETFGGLFKKGPSMTANSLSGSLFGGSSSMSSGSSFSASQGSQTAKKTNYDNVFDLKYAKAFSSPKPDSLDYKEGDRVSHIKFGKGTVLAVEDMKKDYQVTVEFDTAGVKKLFAGFAKLKKI